MRFHAVNIAASAGGLKAVGQVLSTLPCDFPVPVLVVQHIDPTHVSLVADILGRRTQLHVREAHEDDALQSGTVYVAPPGSHMEIDRRNGDRIVHLGHGAPVHYVRPSADRLFESAALAWGPVIAVVLSGSGSDGVGGVVAVKDAGGFVIAQDEATSEFFGMPHAAIASGAVDLVLPLDQIAPTLQRLVANRG